METHNPNEIAKKHLDKWNEVTGFVEKETGYYWELLSVMEDAAKEYAEQRSEAGQLDTLVIRQTDKYWDCECEQDYIREKENEQKCSFCGAIREEQPDSRIVEVKEAGLPL